MSKAPYFNHKSHPVYIGRVMIPSNESRDVEEDHIPDREPKSDRFSAVVVALLAMAVSDFLQKIFDIFDISMLKELAVAESETENRMEVRDAIQTQLDAATQVQDIDNYTAKLKEMSFEDLHVARMQWAQDTNDGMVALVQSVIDERTTIETALFLDGSVKDIEAKLVDVYSETDLLALKVAEEADKNRSTMVDALNQRLAFVKELEVLDVYSNDLREQSAEQLKQELAIWTDLSNEEMAGLVQSVIAERD